MAGFLIRHAFLHALNNTRTQPDIPDIADIKITVIGRINAPGHIQPFTDLNAAVCKAHYTCVTGVNIKITVAVLFQACVAPPQRK